jgi:hypothetical protein
MRASRQAVPPERSGHGTAPALQAGRVFPRKLRISQPGDALEQEADRIAEQALRRPGPDRPGPGLHPAPIHALSIQRCYAACENEELQRKTQDPQVEGAATSGLDSVAITLRQGGRALDPAARAFFEPRFGADFGAVRIHTDSQAAASARAVNALAYTVGNHVVFDTGRYAPHSWAGKRLLAHELAHTLQQQDARILRSPHADPVTAQTDFSAIGARLDAIVRSGPMPDGTRVIGAAIVDIPGYTGAKEIRALSSMATDPLGQGAEVHHAITPRNRTISATRSIAGSGQRREFPFSHVNDAEIKIFEEIQKHLPANAKGTVHFTTMRVRIVSGQAVLEPIPACAGCNRATFEMAGHRNIDFVSHAATHPTGSLDLAALPKPAISEPSQAGHEPVAKTAATAPAVRIATGSAGISTAKGSTSPVTARKIAVELASIEASTRSMAEATKFLNWGLAVWNAATVLEDAAKAISMSTAIMAHGSPFWKEIAQARNIEEKGQAAQRYYNSTSVLKAMPYDIHVEWNSPSELYQIQLNYLIVEGQLNDALESMKDIRSQLQSQSDDLGKAMARRATALMFPVTSLVYAEAFLFADAGGKMNKSLQAADASYQDAQKAIEFQQRLAQAAAKVLEQRMRQLNSRGVFGGMSEKQLKEASSSEFTFRRFQ